jgi:hypothetical protein
MMTFLPRGIANLHYSVAFYYPMLAIINIFIYILKYPTLASTQSDLALLDIGAGHFGQIHYLTSAYVSFKFPRDIIGLAHRAVDRAKAKTANTTSVGPGTPANMSTLNEITVSNIP